MQNHNEFTKSNSSTKKHALVFMTNTEATIDRYNNRVNDQEKRFLSATQLHQNVSLMKIVVNKEKIQSRRQLKMANLEHD